MTSRFSRGAGDARRPRIVVVGDVLLDRDLDGRVARLAPDAPVPVVDAIGETLRPGGAGLAAALCEGRLVCAIGADAAGERLRALLPWDTIDLGAPATGEKVRVFGGGHAYLRLDWGGDASEPGSLTDEAREAIMGADCVLVADYGRGMTRAADVRAALAATPAPVVWDPHPRGGEPVPGALLVTPNAKEAGATDIATAEDRGRDLAERWRAVSVCVTMGARGALLVGGPQPPLVVPAPAVENGDPCGAGDCFAATAARRISEGALPSEAVHAAVIAASAFVARGGASAFATDAGTLPDPVTATSGGTTPDPVALAERIRAEGGTVVATGGCFDLLHAGHVRTLEAARSLGDCLIVLINSDDSVRRLKGPERPLNGEDDRAAVLAALAAVDAVCVFAEDDPCAALAEIRPDIWVKGGDYRVADLPEAAVLAEWGGRPVIVPFVAGKSTTRIIEEAVARVR